MYTQAYTQSRHTYRYITYAYIPTGMPYASPTEHFWVNPSAQLHHADSKGIIYLYIIHVQVCMLQITQLNCIVLIFYGHAPLTQCFVWRSAQLHHDGSKVVRVNTINLYIHVPYTSVYMLYIMYTYTYTYVYTFYGHTSCTGSFSPSARAAS